MTAPSVRPRAGTREVWCVATSPDDVSWHDTKAEALARVDAITRPNVVPLAWPVIVEDDEGRTP